MRATLLLCALALASVVAGQEKSSWTGALADAACKQRTPEAACPVDAGTRAFALVTADGTAPLDAAGNRQAAAAVAAEGSKGNPSATVVGALADGKIQVESLKLD